MGSIADTRERLNVAQELITPREYQELAARQIYWFLRNNPGCNPLCVMPTGTGKSVVIARLCQAILHEFPAVRIMCLTHVMELIEQNARKMYAVWSAAPVGIHSAGLKQRDTFQSIIFGGVKSVANMLDKIGRIDILMIDECHLLSPNGETTYQTIIKHLLSLNPHLQLVGFTATHYRMGQGLLINPPKDDSDDAPAALFTHIVVDQTTPEWWNWFIANGFLVPPISKATHTRFEMANVSVVNGDYNLAQMNRAVDQADINVRVCQEAAALGYYRGKMLAFCAGIEHAEHIAQIFTSMGRPVKAVHNKTTPEDRKRYLAMLSEGQLWGLTNNNVLTTGYDEPAIDFIPMLRPTTSTSLWVQMIGRGTRPFENKHNCLCPDFAANTERLGPVNDPRIPKQKGKGDGEAPVKICDGCGCYCHASVRVCPYCGYDFPIKQQITTAPSPAEIFKGEQPEYKTFKLGRLFTHAHTSKASGKPMIRVSYHCGSKQFSEYLNFEATTGHKHMSYQWWRRFVDGETPATNAEALDRLQRQELNLPTSIRVHINKAMPEVVGYDY